MLRRNKTVLGVLCASFLILRINNQQRNVRFSQWVCRSEELNAVTFQNNKQQNQTQSFFHAKIRVHMKTTDHVIIIKAYILYSMKRKLVWFSIWALTVPPAGRNNFLSVVSESQATVRRAGVGTGIHQGVRFQEDSWFDFDFLDPN